MVKKKSSEQEDKSDSETEEGASGELDKKSASKSKTAKKSPKPASDTLGTRNTASIKHSTPTSFDGQQEEDGSQGAPGGSKSALSGSKQDKSKDKSKGADSKAKPSGQMSITVQSADSKSPSQNDAYKTAAQDAPGSDDNNEFKTAPDEATGKEGSAISGGKSGSGSQGGKEDSKLNASQKQQSAPGSTPDSKSAGSQSQNNLKPMSDDITKTGSDQKTIEDSKALDAKGSKQSKLDSKNGKSETALSAGGSDQKQNDSLQLTKAPPPEDSKLESVDLKNTTNPHDDGEDVSKPQDSKTSSKGGLNAPSNTAANVTVEDADESDKNDELSASLSQKGSKDKLKSGQDKNSQNSRVSSMKSGGTEIAKEDMVPTQSTVAGSTQDDDAKDDIRRQSALQSKEQQAGDHGKGSSAKAQKNSSKAPGKMSSEGANDDEAGKVKEWLSAPPNEETLKKPDDRIKKLQDAATRVNKKYAKGTFQCRIDFNAEKPGRNSIKRPSTYPFELQETGRKVVTSKGIFETLDHVFEESIQFVIDHNVDLENASFSRNMMEDMENLHFYDNEQKTKRSQVEKGRYSFTLNEGLKKSTESLNKSTSTSSDDMSKSSDHNDNQPEGSYSSNTRTVPNHVTRKEKDRLRAIFNFVRIQIKHSRMLELCHYLCHCSTEEFYGHKFWHHLLGDIAMQANFYRTWTTVLLERLIEFSYSCESQLLEVGDLLVSFTKSVIYKQIIMEAFGHSKSEPGEFMEAFIEEIFPNPGSPPERHVLDKQKIKCCGVYELFLVQYLCHCVYLQRLAVLSLPYQILDLLTYSTRTTDREIVNLQEALNESLVCLSIAHFVNSIQKSKKKFDEDFGKDKKNPMEVAEKMELGLVVFYGEGAMTVSGEEAKEGIIAITLTSLFAYHDDRATIIKFKEIAMGEKYNAAKGKKTVKMTLAGKDSEVSISLANSENFKEFCRVWDFIRKTWNSKRGEVYPNGKFKNIAEVDLISRLVALHLWVNLVPVEIDSIDVLKAGLKECDKSDLDACLEHTTLEIGFDMLEKKICSMIKDPFLKDFFSKQVEFCNESQDVVTSREITQFEEVICYNFADLIRKCLKMLPKKPKEIPENNTKKSDNEKILVLFLRTEMSHIEKLLGIVNNLKQIKHSRSRSKQTSSIISIFQFHCNLAKTIADAKSKGSSISQVFAQLPNLSLLTSCLYAYVDDKRLEDLMLLEHWRLLEYLSILEPIFNKSSKKSGSLSDTINLKNIFNYLIVCTSEMLGVVENLENVREKHTGFTQWVINHTSGKMVNRVLRFNTKVVKIEKLDSCQIVTKGKKTITNSKDSPIVMETNSEHPEAFMSVMREGVLVTIGNDLFYHARWYLHYKDVKGVSLYFMVSTHRQKLICDSMLRIEMKDSSFISAWTSVPSQDAKSSPITYFDYLILLLLRSKTRFDVMKPGFPDLSSNEKMLKNLSRFKEKINTINDMTSNAKVTKSTGLTDPDAKATVFKSLRKFRRLFLEEFDINYAVDEGEGGRRNENFSLAFSS